MHRRTVWPSRSNMGQQNQVDVKRIQPDGCSERIVEYDAQGMAMSRPNAAHAVPEVDSIDPPGALDRPVTNGEDHGVALAQRHHLRPRLHPRTLLGHDELSTGEVPARPRQENRDLQREDVLAVDILMQAVVVVDLVLQQERRRLPLPGLVAAREKRRMLGGIADSHTKRLVPLVGDRRQMPVQRRPEAGNGLG